METQKTLIILKSLADPTRLAIVKKLARNGCEVSSASIVTSCAAELRVSQPTMSHHFARLTQAGVLRQHKRGTEKWYQLNRELLDAAGIDARKL